MFRTAPGTKLRGLDRSPSVCYQVDGVDPEARTGWSVLVKGRATPLRDAGEVQRLAGPTLEHWSAGATPDWVRIVAHEVTGRRIRHGSGATAAGSTGAGDATHHT